MAIQTALWTVSPKPRPLRESTLSSEKLLEDMIVASPDLLSEEWFLIGRQEDTGFGGRIDLLAIAPDGSLVLIEIKRDRTPREVVAQAIDYASWVTTLKPTDISQIYRRFAPDRNLAEDFRSRFGVALDEEALNSSHQIVIVAGSLDASTERIVNYLGERNIAINVLCFQVFDNGSEQFLSRAWLHDPVETQVASTASSSGLSEPWNGEFYHSFGHGESRSWEEAVEFGFICGGGAAWYSNTLKQLKAGDRVWVNVPRVGYVGVGIAQGTAVPAKDFGVNGKPIMELVQKASYHREYIDDSEHCEYFVPIQWCSTLALNRAFREVGLFGNQNTVCKPRTPTWRSTVERLKHVFPDPIHCAT